MSAETLVVMLIVGAAAAAVLRRVWRTIAQARATEATRVARVAGAGCPGCDVVGARGDGPAEWDRVQGR